MLKSLFYIFLFLILGEGVKHLFDIPIAGNVVGMVLIFFALKFKIIKLEDVKPASDKLIKYLVLFFVPYGVGLMVYADLLRQHWLVLVVASVVSTVFTLYVTGFIQQKWDKHE